MLSWLSSAFVWIAQTELINAVICLVGAIIGGEISAKATQRVFQTEENKKEQFAATILLYDLRSIERCLKKGDSSVIIRIRYSKDWQSLVADCSFLTGKDVEWIYKFYDEIFDYNYRFSIKSQQDIELDKKRKAYIELVKMMLDFSGTESPQYIAEYQSVINNLQEKAKK